MRCTSVIDSVICLFGKIRPKWFKRLLLSWMLDLFSYGLRLRSLFSQLRFQVLIVSGVEKQTGDMIRLLFVGDKNFPVFLNDLIFSETSTVEQMDTVFIWKIKDLKKRYADKVDAVIVSCDRLYQRFLHQDNFFVFPHMVDMVLDGSMELSELSKRFSRNTKRDIKKMEEHRFSFEITSDIEKLKIFYYDMFLPTLSKRIGETDVFTPDFMFIRYLMEIGYKLMLITYDKKYVCGGFFYHNKDKGYLKYSGVLEGKFSIIKKRAPTAIYYFFILDALKRKAKKIDFGGTRPFFHDGLFQYKKKWGMKVEQYAPIPEIFGLKIVNSDSEPLKQFLFHNPFIGITKKNEMVGFVFVDKDKLSDEEKELYEKRFNAPGIHELRFISP